MTRKFIKKNARRQYSESNLKRAIEAVESGSSIREAAKTFQVPYTTLNRHVNNDVV